MSQNQEPVVGWLTTGHGDELWPGVLLHQDAFLVRAPAELLHDPAGDLGVLLGVTERPIGEVRIIDAGSSAAVPAGHATAMIRLLDQEPGPTTVTVDRTAVTAGWVRGETTWSVLRGLGVLPARWPDPPARHRPGGFESGPIAVKTVQAEPADWCTIFWWLC